jgi:hypothetical protein
MRRWIFTVGALALLAGCDQGKTAKTPVTAPIAPSHSPPPSPSATPATPPQADVLGCDSPVSPTDSFPVLKARFADALRKGDIAGAEGQTAKGAILYGAAPARTLQITFWDAAMAHPSGVSPADTATGWTGPAGLHLGSSLAAVEAANGRPFTIGGFGWDYGGYAIDFKSGALGRIAGGCTLSVRFDAGDSDRPIPDGISGDGVTVMSSDPRVRRWSPVVTQLEIGWSLPPGVTAAP